MLRTISLRSLLILMSLSFGVGFNSCKKDDEGDKNEPFVTSASKFSDPNEVPISSVLTESSDPNAIQASTQAMALRNTLSAYTGFMAVPADADYYAGKVLGSWRWSYSGYSGEYLLEENGSRYEFSYVWTYQGAAYYSFNGWEEKDGTEGYMNLELDGSEAITIAWEQLSNGGYTIDMRIYDGTTVTTRYVGVYNANGSGSIELYDEGVIEYEASWNANGSGSYTSYYNGVVDETGSWN